MSDYVSRFQRSLLDKDSFSITWELVPGRGAFEKAQEAVLVAAEKAARGGKVHALTITDNPGGSPAISAEMLSVEILGMQLEQLGIEPLVHFTCKDKNRNQLESLLYGMERASIHNLLTMTGDYISTGYQGQAKPVFDLDSSQLLQLVGTLNKGIEVPAGKGTTKLAPTHFFAGAAVSPFKALEAEQMGQYFKLKKKLESGAQFIVTQLGYDARKFHEVLLMVKHLGYGHVPVVGNIYVLPLAAAQLMNRNGLPGCVVTDALLGKIREEAAAADKGKAKRLARAAQMYAFMKGMGYAGVHIGGYGMRYEDVEFIIGEGERLAPNWRDYLPEFDHPQPNGWYYFERDPETGLNTETPVDRSKDRPGASFSYRFFRLLHDAMFSTDGLLYKPSRALAGAIDGSAIEPPFTWVEHNMKAILNGCLHCGDCALPDVAYLCVTSQCPKGQRNGPCGGSFEGWCEVYPRKKRCIYVRAYPRLKHYHQEESLGAYHLPPVNYDLLWSNSWLNFFLGRDHSAIRLGIEPLKKPQRKENTSRG